MLLLASTLLTSAHAGVFGPADEDGDGIADRRDGCLVLPETVNGYADEDGCPDHLAVLDVVASISGTPVPATIALQRSSGLVQTKGVRVAEDLIPAESITVTATALCYSAHATLTVAPGHNKLDLDLTPRYDIAIEFVLTDEVGAPLHNATVQFDSICAPTTPVTLADGRGSVRVGVGPHTMTVTATGFSPTTQTVTADLGPVTVALAALPEPIDETDAVADAPLHDPTPWEGFEVRSEPTLPPGA